MRAFDNKYRSNVVEIIAGVDEAGRGPLAGPVVAAAVIFNKSVRIVGINDSKKLTLKEREKLYPKIIEKADAYSVCAISNWQIDRINILKASLLAMRNCIIRLNIKPDLILIDGNKTFESFIPCEAVVDGDAKSFSIAAASILAKVTRDKIMLRLDKKFPLYNWAKNKGYGTKEHIEALTRYGPCCLHRTTFIKKFIRAEKQLTLDFEE